MDGHTYDKSAILAWRAANDPSRCPSPNHWGLLHCMASSMVLKQHSYDRSNLRNPFNIRSPLTGERMSSDVLIPNLAVSHILATVLTHAHAHIMGRTYAHTLTHVYLQAFRTCTKFSHKFVHACTHAQMFSPCTHAQMFSLCASQLSFQEVRGDNTETRESLPPGTEAADSGATVHPFPRPQTTEVECFHSLAKPLHGCPHSHTDISGRRWALSRTSLHFVT